MVDKAGASGGVAGVGPAFDRSNPVRLYFIEPLDCRAAYRIGRLREQMKGLILSGGKGTRLRPLTYTSAKQLIPVANKPILFYGIEAMRNAGITKIGIIVGDTRAEIMERVGDGSRWGVEVEYIYQPEPLGLAHAVLTAESYLGDDEFTMYLGDNLLRDGITGIVNDYQKRKPDCMILLTPVRNPSQFGVAELNEDGSVKKLVEKPSEPKSDLALVGVYLFNKKIFDAARKIKPSLRGELEITDAIQQLKDDGHTVYSSIVEGWWKDTGKLEDMLEANRLVLDTLPGKVEGKVDDASRLEGRVILEPNSRVINSAIRGPVIIGRNVVIENAFIGPYTSIQDRCHISDCDLEHSIILEESIIRNVPGRLTDCLIGRKVVVEKSEIKPHATRLMLGDSSWVSLG
jgi:glucose-1-phosphate thymidylyltransferase